MGRRRVADNDGQVFAALYPALRRFAGAVRPAGMEPDDLVREAVTRTLAAHSPSTVGCGVPPYPIWTGAEVLIYCPHVTSGGLAFVPAPSEPRLGPTSSAP